MWSDKETSEDLLGYTVHANLLKKVVTNKKNLPITVGLYGDWGSGKSSILKILEENLKKDKDAVVIYFDGWAFEDFDDAKMALIQGIIDALEEDKTFASKVNDGGRALKEAFSKLRKSINWMRVLKMSVKTIVPIATAAMTGGTSLIIPALLSAFNENKDKIGDILSGEGAEQFLKDALNVSQEEKKYEAVREFRKDFEELIKQSKHEKIVVLIDDLDRCLPRHIIDNLEAIKLFLNVPGTAFVIAADRFIVSSAIESEYKELIQASSGMRENLGESYMEKFIQLPYKIPVLSPREVETYVTLLFCQSVLDEERFKKVQADFTKFCSDNKFEKYGWENITAVLKADDTPEQLGETIGFVSHFSRIIGNSLRWNPRLIKRFLNAYEIRTDLLLQSGITDAKSRFALLKLMLIEQKYMDQFKQLNNWVMSKHDVPEELTYLEEFADGKSTDISKHKEWDSDDLLKILAAEPKFSSVDMRELFWVSRDNIVDEMSGMSMIPSRIKAIFNQVYNASSDPIRKRICESEIAKLPSQDIEDIYELLDSKILVTPEDKAPYIIYYHCIMKQIPQSYNRLIKILSRITVEKISFSLANKFKGIMDLYNGDTRLKDILSKNTKLMKAIEEK